MGRKTWESIPVERRPLKNRFNAVISRSTHIEPISGQLIQYDNLENSLKELSKIEGDLIVIGGS